MPYQNNYDLPDSVKDNLPNHARDIYREAFNSAWEQYQDPSDRHAGADLEETAHKVAWSAVKQSYYKNAQGDWVRKSA